MNKTAVVTGASRGIGAAVASLFAQNGFNVIVNYKSSAESAARLVDRLTSSGFSALPFKADVGISSEASALVDFAVNSFGSVDVLVNNAGIAEQRLFTDTTDGDWNDMLSVNLTGCFNCCRAAAKYMISKKSGSIVNISSMWGLTGASCECSYSAAKAGMIGLTKSLAKELGPSNIRVNCVAPGVIDTDMNSHLSYEDMTQLINDTPLCRIGTPKDVAEAVFFLASDNASFITGQTLSVNGGFVI